MKKLLYITDQQEYMDHGTIVPLFEGYLQEYFDIKIVYYTKFKHSLQTKNNHIIVPEKFLDDIVDYLEYKKFDMGSYDYLFVRNRHDLLESVLNHREKYNYKVCFRISLPKTKFTFDDINSSMLQRVSKSLERLKQRRLIERCDLFLPASATLTALFFPNLKVPTFPLVCGFDPKKVRTNVADPSAPKSFIYSGTIDNLRSFDTILQAFETLKEKPWKLSVSTFNPTYLKRLLESFPTVSQRIDILTSDDIDELLEQISHHNIGIALVPPLEVYTTTLPSKTMDYLSAGAAVLLNDTPKYRSLLSGDEGYFCEFEPEKIAQKIEQIIDTDIEQIKKSAKAGLERFATSGRGYDRVAQQLASRLDEL